jgi:hypothetical protein
MRERPFARHVLTLIATVALGGLARPAQAGWFNRVAETQSEQPHWITPLVTVTPLLEEEYRFDFDLEALPYSRSVDAYGAGKGLELIPARSIEVILGQPSYNVHSPDGAENGFGDASLLVKYRLTARNQPQGNYVVSLFFGATAPTAGRGNGPGRSILTPTLAAGKGGGPFDLRRRPTRR